VGLPVAIPVDRSFFVGPTEKVAVCSFIGRLENERKVGEQK
jgi:hypothetical protein